jgi:disulfide bond formation protein DsbB
MKAKENLMRNRTLFLCTLAAALVVTLSLTACGGGGAAPTAAPAGLGGDAAKGQALFTGTCSACHGPDATGITGLGKNLTTSTFVAEKTDETV